MMMTADGAQEPVRPEPSPPKGKRGKGDWKEVRGKMKYQLSICIPQYNRRECLQELLDSIISQDDCPAPVEICISDDASTDDTYFFVQEYMNKYPHIRYYRFAKNVGIDANMLKAVSLANGEYCWLMGNDDKIEATAVKTLTPILHKYNGIPVFNVNGWQYDNKLQVKLYHRVKKGLKRNSLTNSQLFNNMDEILYYFGDSFGFLGDNIFKRSLWNAIIDIIDISTYLGSHYIHLAVLLSMLQQDTRFLYIHDQCVGFRGGNDGFLEIMGQYRRVTFDVKGYDTVAEGVFSKESHLYKIWMTRVIKVHIFDRVRSLKVSQCDYPLHDLCKCLYDHFASVPAFWLNLVPLLITPRQLLIFIQPFYRSIIKPSRLFTKFES